MALHRSDLALVLFPTLGMTYPLIGISSYEMGIEMRFLHFKNALIDCEVRDVTERVAPSDPLGDLTPRLSIVP
jgi:hypothetical protein